jgi:hypothetical protein
MAHAYTPGLTVSAATVVRKRRILPLRGEVVVGVGDKVGPDTVVARTDLPGKVHTKNVAADMGLPPSDLEQTLVKKEGETVKKEEAIAEHKSFFGLFRARSLAPIDGTLENVSSITGQAIYREPPIPVEVLAYVRGVVQEVVPQEGVVVKAKGALVQGIFGVGGETHGPVAVGVSSPDAEFEPGSVKADHAGKVIIGGKHASLAAIREAAKVGARGLVVGGIHDDDLRELLGYDLGVAITGSEEIGVTLIVTEGFGLIAMARKTFELLSRFEGQEASINGATQIRAGVIRPELIIPHDGVSEAQASQSGIMEVGSLVRIIREPYFGLIGSVAELPPELQALESEAKVRVLDVNLKDGRRVRLPRANVELIEG